MRKSLQSFTTLVITTLIILPLLINCEIKMSHKITYLEKSSETNNNNNAAAHSRWKRDSKLSTEEREAGLLKHNELRSKEPAKNMEEMSWDTTLAEMAQKWAENCEFEHGQPSGYGGIYSSVGQNLFISTGKTTISKATQVFFDEKKYYTYETLACSKKPCGHYTQVVWYDSSKLGCARHFCPTVKSSTWKNAELVVCNYHKPGNFVGEKIYKLGKQCTGCPANKAYCRNNLCSACKSTDTGCSCKRFCANCGEKTSDCNCKCKVGFTSTDCGEKCRDFDSKCGQNPGFPKSFCTKSDSVLRNCPAMCGTCEVANTDTSNCPKEPTDTGKDCGTETCDNGGTSESSGDNTCACKCTSAYYGKKCEKSRQQLKFGIRLNMKMSLNKWSLLWSRIRGFIANALNKVCRKSSFFSKCCKGKTGKAESELTSLTYIDSSRLSVAEGYPEENPNKAGVIRALIIAKPNFGNDLCAKGSSSKRRKRAADDEFLPQDVLNEAVNEARTEISAEAKSCCEASIDNIEIPDPNEGSNKANGIRYNVGLMLMGLGILAVLGWFN